MVNNEREITILQCILWEKERLGISWEICSGKPATGLLMKDCGRLFSIYRSLTIDATCMIQTTVCYSGPQIYSQP